MWLVPPRAARWTLAQEIRSLATRLGTPCFQPHITLLSGLAPARLDSARAVVAGLARRTPPVEVRFQGIDQDRSYFRCVLLRVDCSGPLLAAHEAARRALAPAAAGTFWPHLSLVYGSLSQARRRRLLDELRDRGWPGFRAESLELWLTRGEVANWRRVESHSLRGAD